MNVRHPMRFFHSFSIKNIFSDKMGLQAFLFLCYDVLIKLPSFRTQYLKVSSKELLIHFSILPPVLQGFLKIH